MDCLFTTTTVLLSPEFSEAYSYKEARSKLQKLRLVTGVQFTCKANKTYALHGTWEQIQASFDILSHWQAYPEHGASVLDKHIAKNASNVMCDCLFVKEVLLTLDGPQIQSESRNAKTSEQVFKQRQICINTSTVKEDIENLKDELTKLGSFLSQTPNSEQIITGCGKSRSGKSKKSISRTHLASASTRKEIKDHSELDAKGNANAINLGDPFKNGENLSNNFSSDTESYDDTVSTTDQNQVPLESNAAKINRNNNSNQDIYNTLENKIKSIDINLKQYGNDKTKPNETKVRRKTARKPAVPNKLPKEGEILNVPNEITTNTETEKKQKRKPGDKGYWSRVKRNDVHLEHQCSLCGVVLKSRKRFLEHKRRIHLKEYRCKVCLRGFGYPTDLHRHKCSPVQDGEKQLQDQSKGRLIISKQKTTENKIKKSGYLSSLKFQGREYNCETCSKKFNTVREMRRHKKSAHKCTIYVCEKCSKIYKSKSHFDLHMKSHEPGFLKPNFMCASCGKTFTTKYALVTHNRSQHLGMKLQYLCQICGKKFSQRSSYKQHTNAHFGIQPYQCDECGKSFTYHKSLREHKFMHDNIRRFKCECGKQFRQRTTLHIHLKTHKLVKDHICSVCSKEFAQKQALERHERIHSGIRPYKCTVCQKTFGDASTIRRHMLAIHRKGETDWRDSIISSVKKKSDYYVTGGSGQNRTYVYKKNKTNKIKVEEPPAERQKSDAIDTVENLNEKCEFTAENVETNGHLQVNQSVVLNQLPSLLQVNQSQSIQPVPAYTSTSSKSMQAHVPSLSVSSQIAVSNLQTQGTNVLASDGSVITVPSGAIPSHVHSGAIPSHVHSGAIQGHVHSGAIQGHVHSGAIQGHVHSGAIQGHVHSGAIQGQGSAISVQNTHILPHASSFPVQRNIELLNLSAISFIPAKPADDATLTVGSSKSGASQQQFQQLYQVPTQQLDQSGSGPLVPVATPVVAPSEGYKLASNSTPCVPVTSDSVVNQSFASIWGFVGYPSYYTTGSAPQYQPPTSQ